MIFFYKKQPKRKSLRSLFYCLFSCVVVEIVEQSATLTDQLGQRARGDEVLVVLLHMLREVLDAVGEEGNLALSGTRVLCFLVVTELGKDLLLLSFV